MSLRGGTESDTVLPQAQKSDDYYKQLFRRLLDGAAEVEDPNVGNSLLIKVIHTVESDNELDIFVKNECAKRIPFRNTLVADRVFDLLRILAERAPQVFDESVIAELPAIAAANPRKFLMLLAIYAQHTRHTEVFRVVFENPDLFLKRDCFQRLISLLVWMVENNQRFKAKFSANVASVLNSVALTANGEAAADCYTALCHLLDLGIDVDEVPAARLVVHLEDDEVRPPAISFMLRRTPKHGNLTQLVNSLVQLARTAGKVSYVLVKMARMAKVVQILLDNPLWMTLGLPEPVHTLRLFCQVMTFVDLRPVLVSCEHEVAAFFVCLLTLRDESIPLIICSLMKRLPLTKSLVLALSDAGFIDGYFNAIKQDGNTTQGLILLNQLACGGYSREYDTLVDFVIDNIQTKEYCSTALKTATTLCAYQKCRRKFIARRVSEYLYKNHKRGKLVDAFLDAVGD